VVHYVPADLPVADVHLEQLDAVFELDDGSLRRSTGPRPLNASCSMTPTSTTASSAPSTPLSSMGPM
jgi:hypothetical protein